jgi:GT2 family glycosyltransferase
MDKPLVSIIVLSYNSRRYIEKCLNAVLGQDYPNLEILIVVTGSDDGSDEFLKNRYRRFKKIRILEPGENLWFSRGNNFGINQARGEYVLSLNQDTIMERNFISLLVKALEEDRALGSVTGKLLHYKFDIDSKTRILDSTGIEIFRTRRVIDRGQWEIDFGQYDLDTEVFGASGAAAMYRHSALEEIKLPKPDGGFEYFDEDFLAYKEDVDLAWRLALAGYKCRYVPEALVYHGRSVGRSWPTQVIRFILNRRRQSRLVRKLSFKNHYLMMVKNELPELFWRHFLFILCRELLLFFYTLIFEPFQVSAVIQFFRELPEARRKRKLVMAKVKIDSTRLRRLFD